MGFFAIFEMKITGHEQKKITPLYLRKREWGQHKRYVTENIIW
jgi:hypothetical protein